MHCIFPPPPHFFLCASGLTEAWYCRPKSALSARDERLSQRVSSIVTGVEQHDAVGTKLDTVSGERYVPFELYTIFSHNDNTGHGSYIGFLTSLLALVCRTIIVFHSNVHEQYACALVFYHLYKGGWGDIYSMSLQ